MIRLPVSSSTILSVGYDPQTRVMQVEFKSGRVYNYFDISEHLYQQFMNTSSKGQFLDENIKYNYRYQKVE